MLPVELLVMALALFPLSCIECFYDFASMMDGPAVGLFPGGPLSLGPMLVVMVVSGLLGHFAWRAVPDEGKRRIAKWGAVALCVAFLVVDAPRKLFALSWTAQCRHGDARACSAAGDLYALGLGVERDSTRALELFRSGCEQGYFVACGRVLNAEPGDRRACDRLAEQCEHDKWREFACRVRADKCPATSGDAAR